MPTTPVIVHPNLKNIIGSNKKQGISSSLHITTAENPNGIAPEVGEIHLPTLNPTKNMQKANIINSSTLKSSNQIKG